MDDLDRLKSALDTETPRPDTATKAAHLALALQNFDNLQVASPSLFERLRMRMTRRIGGAFATSVAVCFGAMFLILPQTPDAPQMQPAPAMLKAADDLFAESSMADAAQVAEVAPMSRAMARPVMPSLQDQLIPLFKAPSITSVRSPWSPETWLVFVAIAPGQVASVAFDSNVTVQRLGDDTAVETSMPSRGSLRIFEVSEPAVQSGQIRIGEVKLEADDPRPIQLGAQADDPQRVTFGAAVIGFLQMTQQGSDLGAWGIEDAIALAEANGGDIVDGQVVNILAQMRAIAGQ